MTYHANAQFHKADEELVFRYSMKHVGGLQLILSLLLILVSFYNITLPFSVIDDNFMNRTSFIVENYKVYPNGTRYVWLPDEETGEEKLLLLEQWVEHYKVGKFMYAFGGNYNNYCWPREIPEEDWVKSLLRSCQLKAMVQVPFRVLTLLTIAIRIFEVILIGSNKTLSRFPAILFSVFVFNEIIHNIVKFETVNFLISPDDNYLYVFIPVLQLLHFTFVVKMVVSSFYAKSVGFILFRIFLGLLSLQCYHGIMSSARDFLENPFCDEYVNPGWALSEFGFLLIIMTASIVDVLDCKNYEFMDEKARSYFYLKWKHLSCAYALITFLLISTALYNSSSQPVLPNRNFTIENHDRQWIIQNYKVYPNNTKYFIGTKANVTREIQLHNWFDRVLGGQTIYSFGGNFHNFCWNRDKIPLNENTPSLFNSSQLKASVQIPLRTAVLIGFCIRIIQIHFIFKLSFNHSINVFSTFLLEIIGITNEIILNGCMFITSAFLITPDANYKSSIPLVLNVLHSSFVAKMLLSSFLKGIHIFSVIRLFMTIVSIMCWQPIVRSIELYVNQAYCDSYVTTFPAVCQIAMLLILYITSVLDSQECKSIELRIFFEADSEDYRIAFPGSST